MFRIPVVVPSSFGCPAKRNDTEKGCGRGRVEIREKHAADAVADIPRWSDRDQSPHCGGKGGSTVYYIHGHLPVFRHAENDMRGFRMFTSQMIVNGTVKPKEIVQVFDAPMIAVKRSVKVFREQGANGFYAVKPRHSSASVLKGEVLQRAQQLLDEGQSVTEVASELKVLANTLHKAVDAERLR
jgi:hypothetical protein